MYVFYLIGMGAVVFGFMNLTGGIVITFMRNELIMSETTHELVVSDLTRSALIISYLIRFIAAILFAQILFIRAQAVNTMGKSPFTAIPIAAVVLAMIGEVVFVLLLTSGVSDGVVIWLLSGSTQVITSGGNGYENITVISPVGLLLQTLFGIESPFRKGIALLFSEVILGYVGLVLFYLLSESTSVLVSIWQQIHQVSKNTSGLLTKPSANSVRMDEDEQK
jgi:hypothetical protein